MSHIVIALLLIVPIILVIIILNSTGRKTKKQADVRILAFITEVLNKHGLDNHFHKRLLYQTAIIDEKKKQMAVIDHKAPGLAYEVHHLTQLKKVEVTHLKMPVVSHPKSKRQEHITTHVGVTIIPQKGKETFLCLYDYMEHNVHLLTDYDQAARQLKEKIETISNHSPVLK